MVTISRTRTDRLPFTSIRWQILLSFLLIIAVSFAIMLSRLTGFVSDYLYEQRIRQDSLSVEKLALAAAPLLDTGAWESLSDTLTASGAEMGGRLMAIDGDGKVQYDTYGRYQGQRLQLPEVLKVITGGSSSAYGIHPLAAENGDTSDYVAYCAARLPLSEGKAGVLLYISTVTTLVQSLQTVEQQLLYIFLIIAAAAMLVALLFAHVLTKPIVGLTRSIQRMGRGDLSVRVKVKGSGELRELARSYNAMAQQLETLDKSRNQFVSNASHELKTPMATMKILLENLLEYPDMPEEMRTEFMTDINHEIDRLTTIVTDLLTITRMDGHQMKLTLADMDLSALVEENIRLLRPNAQQRQQNLMGRVAPGVRIRGDASKLGQVIYNLTENALKYTGDGGRILVSLSQRGRLAVLTVQDNGVGIPAEDLPHIFERFYRVDKARSRETGGTGLGLSIAKQMVELHGGRIRVDSVHKQGSTFTVQLPIDMKEGQA